MINATLSVREKFFLWLSEKVSPAQLSEYFIVCIDIEKFCLHEKILEKNLFEITDLKSIENLIYAVTSNKTFKKFRAEYGHSSGKIVTALQNYCTFLKTNSVSKVNNNENLEKSAPQKKIVTSKTESVAEKAALNKKAFKEWLKVKYINETTALQYLKFAELINRMLQDKKIVDTDLFLITESEKLKEIKANLFKTFSFANFNLVTAFDNLIEFRQSNSLPEKIPEPSVKAEISEVKELSNLDKYAKILSKFFGENGYQPGKVIYLKRFKKYFFDEYGENLSQSGEEIEEILKKVGTQRDQRIFPKQNDNQNQLIDDIVKDIEFAFESGASAVFIEAVYEKYKQPLADKLKIYTEKACVPLILQNANGKFKYCTSYFTCGNRKADPAGDILRFMKEFHQPLSYDKIFKSLWYIPRNKLESLIKNQILSVVYVGNAMFFYAPNLPTDETDLQKISSLLQAETDFHGYITDVKMMELIKSKYPFIAMNLESFSTYAVRKCLSYILREKFAFNGSIISASGTQLNLSNVFADFAREHENLTLEELKNFAKELETGIYWSPVLNEMVRISQNNFVRKDLIIFDVRATDNFLEEMYPQKYIPLKEISLFINFPNAGYAWNIYLLESYLYSFSRKFKLVHSSFSEGGVYGAMVRVDSSISDYESLITDALSYSDSLTESKALQFIVDKGFQQRKAYKNIGDVIRNAKIIKENRRKF